VVRGLRAQADDLGDLRRERENPEREEDRDSPDGPQGNRQSTHHVPDPGQGPVPGHHAHDTWSGAQLPHRA
jgi:hypothetical protein